MLHGNPCPLVQLTRTVVVSCTLNVKPNPLTTKTVIDHFLYSNRSLPIQCMSYVMPLAVGQCFSVSVFSGCVISKAVIAFSILCQFVTFSIFVSYNKIISHSNVINDDWTMKKVVVLNSTMATHMKDWSWKCLGWMWSYVICSWPCYFRSHYFADWPGPPSG